MQSEINAMVFIYGFREKILIIKMNYLIKEEGQNQIS